MIDFRHDAIVDINTFNTCVRTLTPQSRNWVETHVTVGQVDTWVDGILEIALPVSNDLIRDMLKANLRVVPSGGRMIMNCAQLVVDTPAICVSPN